MVFGRAGEEIAALRKAGIACSIVPGVTAALAAAADTATPVTLRKVSSGLLVATAHGADDAELGHWAALAQAGVTLALYMGRAVAAETAAGLISHGMAAGTPVGLVVNAGRRERSLVRGTLGELSALAEIAGDGPAVILVGETVAAGEWSGAATLAAEKLRVA
jgi:uroporphyrin-III C-methyltransferase/precorrin-2 dehydrogenase/sirohydrochlorin ferrochelatase